MKRWTLFMLALVSSLSLTNGAPPHHHDIGTRTVIDIARHRHRYRAQHHSQSSLHKEEHKSAHKEEHKSTHKEEHKSTHTDVHKHKSTHEDAHKHKSSREDVHRRKSTREDGRKHKSTHRSARRHRARHTACTSSSSPTNTNAAVATTPKVSDDSSSASNTPTNATSTPSTGTSSSSSSSSGLSALTTIGITGFLSQNGPGIGSWFRTDSGQDSTNGHSWCGYPYNDDSNGFAPDVQVMLDNFGGDYNTAAAAYCGLEAIVTTPSGVSKTMYIIDGFDHRWVRSAGSIDITKNRFADLYGSATDDKNIVIQGITWKLTGNRSDQYKFKGAGN